MPPPLEVDHLLKPRCITGPSADEPGKKLHESRIQDLCIYRYEYLLLEHDLSNSTPTHIKMNDFTEVADDAVAQVSAVR